MKRALIFCAFLAGCATPPVETSASSSAADKVRISQTVSGGHGEYVACAERHCLERTQKVVAIEEKPAARAPTPEASPQPRPTSHRIHFKWGSARLSPGAKLEVSAAAKNALQATSIVIRGGTDPTGGNKANLALALKRALVVKKALVDAGIPADRISAVRHSPCCAGSNEPNWEQRRADIEIEIFTGPKK